MEIGKLKINNIVKLKQKTHYHNYMHLLIAFLYER